MSSQSVHRPTAPRSDLAIAAVLLVVFAAALVTSYAWESGAARFPRVVCAAGVVFCLALLLAGAVARRTPLAPQRDPRQDGPDGPEDTEYVFATVGRRAWVHALAWVVGFLLLLFAYGLFTAGPLFAAAYLRFGARRSWLFSLAYALVLAVVLLAAFRWLLFVQVPLGYVHFA